MNEADLRYNINMCREKIEEYSRRIDAAKVTGEDVKDLKQRRAGYEDKLKELTESAD